MRATGGGCLEDSERSKANHEALETPVSSVHYSLDFTGRERGFRQMGHRICFSTSLPDDIISIGKTTVSIFVLKLYVIILLLYCIILVLLYFYYHFDKWICFSTSYWKRISIGNGFTINRDISHSSL